MRNEADEENINFIVAIYNSDELVDQKRFGKIHEVFAYLGTAGMTGSFNRCVVQDGGQVLFDLDVDAQGKVSP